MVYEKKNRNNHDFKQRHSNIFGSSKLEPDKVQEHKVMLENYNSHLINLGLIGKLSSFDSFSSNRQIYEYQKLYLDLYINYSGKLNYDQLAPDEKDKPHIYLPE